MLLYPNADAMVAFGGCFGGNPGRFHVGAVPGIDIGRDVIVRHCNRALRGMIAADLEVAWRFLVDQGRVLGVGDGCVCIRGVMIVVVDLVRRSAMALGIRQGYETDQGHRETSQR